MIGQNEQPEQLANDGLNVEASQEQQPQVEQAQPQAVPETPWGGADFNPQNYKMDFKGQTRYPTDSAHAKNLMQQGLSYSQSMETLNKRNTELDTRSTELEGKYSKYSDFDQKLQNDPQLYNRFNEFINNPDTAGTTTSQGQSFNPVYDQKIQDLTSKLDGMTQAEEDRTLRSNMDKLKDKHQSYDWNTDNGDGNLETRILTHANNLKLNENQLHLAFQDYFAESLQAQAQTQGAAQVAGKVQSQNKAGIAQGPNATAPASVGTPIDHKGSSYNNLAALAKAKYAI